MAVPFDTPVSAIEGIGPAAERLFQAQGVHSVYDLLRAPSPALHGAVSALASFEEARDWRHMAVLLEVAAVTPQWAEALVKAGVTALAELRRLDLSELQALFATAQDQGIIPDLPTADQAAAMLKDAALLDFAGAVTGTVKDRDGNPVAGATVTGGGAEMTTDPRGRFRLRRLPLGGSVALRIALDGFQPLTSSEVPLPTAMVSVRQHVLAPAVNLSPRASGQPAARGGTVLSELRGDHMPALRGIGVTSHEVPAGSLPARDLLVFTEVYANGTDVKLVSKLLEFDGGRIVVHWVRLPRVGLPAGAAVGDHFVKTAGGYRPVRMDQRKLMEYKRYLRSRASLPAAPMPGSDAERTARLRERFAALERTPR